MWWMFTMLKPILQWFKMCQYLNKCTWVHVKNLVFSNTRYPKYPMILKNNRVRIGYWKIFRVRVGYRVPVGPWSLDTLVKSGWDNPGIFTKKVETLMSSTEKESQGQEDKSEGNQLLTSDEVAIVAASWSWYWSPCTRWRISWRGCWTGWPRTGWGWCCGGGAGAGAGRWRWGWGRRIVALSCQRGGEWGDDYPFDWVSVQI